MERRRSQTLHRIPPLNRFFGRALSVSIASLMFLQTAVGQAGAGIAIQILDSSEGQNLVAQETSPIKVRVTDRAGRALSGANVLFVAPEEGATGFFLPSSSQVSATTNNQGVASTPKFRTNTTVGSYQIQIVASYNDSVSRVVIPQSNVLERKSSKKKILILSATIGAAAVAAFAAKGNSSGPAAQVLGTIAGTPTRTVGGSTVGFSPTVPVAPLSVDATPPTAPAAAPAITVTPAVAPVPSIIQTLPSAVSQCDRMPPNSNRRDCR